MKYIYISQFHDNCGYGSAARGNLRSMQHYFPPEKLKILSLSLETVHSHITESDKEMLDKYDLSNKEALYDFIEKEEYVILWHMPPPMSEKVMNMKITQETFRKATDNLNILAWEATKLPDRWVEIYKKRKTKNVIVPSVWNQTLFKDLDIKAHLIPHSLEEPRGLSKPMDLPLDFKKNFVVFSMSQWQHRKGYDTLIRAFCMEFGDVDNACLLIKTYGIIMSNYAISQAQQARSIVDQARLLKESIELENGKKAVCKVIVIPKVIPEEEINWLYEQSHVFALATRGEGFGLTIAEATMSGLPVVVPDAGGHLDYLKNYKNKYFFKGCWSPYHSIPGYSCNMNWYEPDIISIRKSLRNAYNDWTAGRLSRERNNPIGFSEKEVGKRFKDVLEGAFEND